MIACRHEAQRGPNGREARSLIARDAATRPDDLAMTVTIPSHFLEDSAWLDEAVRLSSRPRISIISR